MNEFIKILLSLFVSGALLLLLILGLKPLYKNKFSKRWQYYIWIVVALRFAIKAYVECWFACCFGSPFSLLW